LELTTGQLKLKAMNRLSLSCLRASRASMLANGRVYQVRRDIFRWFSVPRS